MFPKRSVLKILLRKADLELKGSGMKHYTGLIQQFVVDFPLEIQHKVLGLLRAKDYVKLLEWADSFDSDASAQHRGVAYKRAASQLTALIKKYPFPAPNLKEIARSRAWEKFLLAENRCRRYNLKFQRLETGRWDPMNDILQRMSGYISHVIGFTPPLKKIYGFCGFGPGASVGVHGNATNLARKLLASAWTCTPAALPFALSALAQDQHVWELLLKREGIFCLDYDAFRKEALSRIELVHFNKIVFVPKTTLVDRTIAVEPLLNGYLQKGVDNYMRLCLKRVGLDLTDQTVNQNLAFQGSIPDQQDPFVTIDLSSASDSLSIGVVRRLLPPDWFDFLNYLRAHTYLLDDKEVSYHKFTSMGNGFCFPLETLIFASVCAIYSKPNDFSVYGDDIIVRRSVADKVISVLKRIGFRHNPSKTFLEGPFRESCGADWYEGRDVRPLTLDYHLDSFESIVQFHNLSMQKDFWSDRFFSVRKYLKDLVPQEIRFKRPYIGQIGTAFEVPLDEFQSCAFSSWDRYAQAWSWYEAERTGRPDKGLHTHDRFTTVLTMAALRGSPSSKPFSLRRETAQTVRRKSYAGAKSTINTENVNIAASALLRRVVMS